MSSIVDRDLIGMVEYILEMEYEDMVQQLTDEPTYLEEGIVTEKEIEQLSEGPKEDIVIKACMNPLNLHIYALAYRTWRKHIFKSEK